MGLLERVKRAWNMLVEGKQVQGDYVLKIVDLDNIISNPYQPRTEIDEEKLEELARSIEEYGVITPIQVMPTDDDQYQLVAGERRVRASRSVGLGEIPALIRDFSEEEMFEVSFLDNLHREPMSAVDKAMMYERLQSEFKNLSVEELSDIIGQSPEEITKREWILNLPGITKRAMSRGIITEQIAKRMEPLSDEDQKEIISYVANEEPDKRAIHERIDEYTNDSSTGDDNVDFEDQSGERATSDEAEPMESSSIEEDLDIPGELQDR